jgi:hypothetical protein
MKEKYGCAKKPGVFKEQQVFRMAFRKVSIVFNKSSFVNFDFDIF